MLVRSGSIKSAATDSSLSAGASISIPTQTSSSTTLAVTFYGLSSLQTYEIFCYAESSIGTGTSITIVQQTSAVATTLCCKALDFTNAPASVYGDVSKYIGLSTSLYVFDYELSASPASSVQITPSLYLNGILSKDVTAFPSNYSFLSNSPLSGQFFLSASSFTSGTYSVGFVFTGPSRSQYSSEAFNVEILSSALLSPAPIMESVQFSDSGQFIIIAFDRATDFANIIASMWNCSILFNFTGLSSTTCSWSSSTAVTITFRAITSVSSSDGLSIGSPVTRYCSESNSDGGSTGPGTSC